ncbi:MAG: hypothetical protein ABI880_05035 [Acidobacteriota bacterium]
MAVLSSPRRQTLLAAAAYAALTVVMTWPIARGLAHDVPADLGDSLLNMWIMAWVADGAVAMARGAMSFADLWNANIFHPSTLSLTFSEHLVPLALQGAPLYLTTGNIVLAYNAVFLATFALSGLGMFLFVREVTGSAKAAFVAGLFYAFAPYRLGQFPHIQTVSSQWMPFALYGMRRYFDSGRLRALAWGTAAFIVQGLSSGYYLFYFAPVLLGYALWEMWIRQRLLDARTWLALAVSGVTAVACVLPFLLPYAEARARFGFTRPYGEVMSFSADLFAYLNAPPQLHLWGPILDHYPQPEGDLFPGAVPIVLGLAAVALWLSRAFAATRNVPLADRPARQPLVRVLVALTLIACAGASVIAVTGGYMWEVAGVTLRMTSVRRALTYAVCLSALALWFSPRLRAGARAQPRDLTPFLLAAVVFAVVMSLGPVARAGGIRVAGLSLYAMFFDWVPGFDGLRAPARFAMVAALMLAALSGSALATIARWRRAGPLVLVLVSGLFLAEAYAVPMPVNLTWSSSARFAPPWPTIGRLNDGPLVYRSVLLMPPATVLLEMPFGDQGWDLRYVYYAGLHGKRIVNGYSGYFPDGYLARASRLTNLWRDGDAAWSALNTAGASHVVVHERAYKSPEGAAVSSWILNHGARLLAEFSDGDKLFALPAH